MNNWTNCLICGSLLSGKQKMFCSLECKNSQHQSYIAQQRRWLLRKIELISRFWGKCSICGYAKNISALSFHHLDPTQKNFKLDIRSLSNRKIERIEQELSKCSLICHNCHSELHNPHLDLASLL